jgi:hypothetical protein
MFWSWLHIVLFNGNKQKDIRYNMNYIKVFQWLWHLLLDSIDYKIISQGEMRFENLKNQWL